MKILLGAVAAALLLAPVAFAQTAPPAELANCAAFAAAPTLPDGATANSAAMAAGSTTYDAWHAGTESKKVLCQTDVAELRTRLNAMVEAYNQAEAQRFATQTAWGAEIAEFNARGGSSRRQRGGVNTRTDH
jgi:opacity protein-like surface antigen